MIENLVDTDFGICKQAVCAGGTCVFPYVTSITLIKPKLNLTGEMKPPHTFAIPHFGEVLHLCGMT